ncbi:MAG: undecaprenyl-phosphate glucose phosphotransferase [Anaerolineales bacterium]|nr:undecaprenyl-phosphate glucose phosphotransferase [Anaerolineales bacterium]
MKRSQVFIVLLQVVADIFLAAAAFYAAYRINLRYDPTVGSFGQYVPMMVIFVATLTISIFLNKLYSRRRGRPRFEEMMTLFTAITLGALVAVALVSFAFKNTVDYRRPMMVLAWLLSVIFLIIGRIVIIQIQRGLMRRGVGNSDVLLIGTGEVAHMVLERMLGSPQLGYNPVGLISMTNGAEQVLGYPVLGAMKDIPRVIESRHVQEVIICLPEATHRELVQITAQCERERVTIRIYPDVFQIMAREVGISDLAGLPLLTMRDVALRGWHLALKRTVDVIGSALGLVFLSPLMMLTAVAIKLESPGPVFYLQERMGLDARPFMMYKFRSMRTDAEQKGPGWTTADDPRRTRIGAFLRRASVDELPQLINVLLGDMSLVGPRPERPVYVDQFRQSIPRYMDRHREKAGLTGWAQVNGLRGDTSIAERTKYDLWYIENWSLSLDLRILLRTVLRIFGDNSAY